MQIQVNANHHVPGGSSLVSHVENVVKHVLEHYKDQVTRVEVHLSDENSHKGGDHDMRCMMEARIRGLHPIAVTHHGENMNAAIEGAADRIERAVRKTVEKRRDH